MRWILFTFAIVAFLSGCNHAENPSKDVATDSIYIVSILPWVDGSLIRGSSRDRQFVAFARACPTRCNAGLLEAGQSYKLSLEPSPSMGRFRRSSANIVIDGKLVWTPKDSLFEIQGLCGLCLSQRQE